MSGTGGELGFSFLGVVGFLRLEVGSIIDIALPIEVGSGREEGRAVAFELAVGKPSSLRSGVERVGWIHQDRQHEAVF